MPAAPLGNVAPADATAPRYIGSGGTYKCQITILCRSITVGYTQRKQQGYCAVNFRQMECLRAVMTTGTVTRAAALLGVSQPAASGLIRSLEREIGFPLFVRTHGRLQPTPEARFLHEDVERTLGSLDRTIQTARAIRGRTQGQLVVASYPGIAIDFLPRVISEFLRERPNVSVELHSRSAQVIHELIPAQGFDIAIVDLPANRHGVHTEPLLLECVAVIPRQHALAAKKVVTPRDLDGVPFISLFREHVIHFRVVSAFAAANAHCNIVAMTRLFATNCAFVAYGAGVSIVDPITAADYASRGVVTRRFAPRILYEIGLLYPTERPRGRLVDALADLLKQRLAPHLAAPGRAG